MKKLGFIVAALLVAAVGSSFAQTNDYLVKLKGTAISDAGKQKVTEADLLSTNVNTLVLRIIKNTSRSVELQERDASGTNLVSTPFSSFREAFLADGRFAADLEQDDFDLDGDLQIQGKETPVASPTKVKAKIVGILNDTIANTNDVDVLFSGSLSGTILP